MGLFSKKKKDEPKKQNTASNGDFDKDIAGLLERDDIQCKQDICKAEYEKADKLISTNPTQESINSAYNIMVNLVITYDYVPAMIWIGNLLEFSLKDPYNASKWYKKAADSDDAYGARCYADMVMNGIGVPQNDYEARVYYEKAANLGNPDSMFVMGEFLRTEGRRTEALDWYKKAVAAGFDMANIRIEQMEKGER